MQASLATIPCQLPGPGIEYRECEAVLRVNAQSDLSNSGRCESEAPGSKYVESKRHPHLTPQLLDIPAQEHASGAPPRRRRNPAARPFRCASRPRPELPLARPLGYDLLSIAIFSDPRPCEDAPRAEQSLAFVRSACRRPSIARPAQNPLPLSPAGGPAAAQEAQVCEPDWKTESRAPSHRLRPSLAGVHGFRRAAPASHSRESLKPNAALSGGRSSLRAAGLGLRVRAHCLAWDPGRVCQRKPPPPPPALEEDFNSGLARWIGETAAWKLDVAGARPGGLALLEPSLSWTDYDFEFLTRIGKRSVTFVFRASDVNNYHRITIGPAESGGYELRRSVVIAGNEEPVAAVPAGERLRAGSAIQRQGARAGQRIHHFDSKAK